MAYQLRIPAILLLFGCLACDDDTGKNAGNTGICTDLDGLQTCWNTGNTNNQGILPVSVNVNSGAGAFLLTAFVTGDAYPSVEAIRSPEGSRELYWDDWYTSDYNLTAGILPLGNEMMINWPIRAEDPALSAGRYTVNVAVIDTEGYYQLGKSVTYYTQVKQDDSFSSGTVQARIVYVDDLGDNATITGATEDAVAIWRAIWSTYGLTLSVDYDTRPEVDAAIPSMTEGSEDISEISATGTDADITVIICDTVGGTTQIYGESGGIPGTLVEGRQSAVALSWITNAGGDGTFSTNDIQVYGETLAHEVGHYMGLFHPVDFNGNRAQYWDALSDTDECNTTAACDASLGENNMYPYPVCIGFNNCLDQQSLSTGQAGVLHRYTGAL
ncbi:MAG TPA: hypothetical protein DFR83_10735 [Deltaproteobacteria bacterium]|nr:hypothetical protein [Deltaproteobacteria bacterium]